MIVSLDHYLLYTIIDVRTGRIVSRHRTRTDALVAHDSLEWGWHIIRGPAGAGRLKAAA